MGNNLHNHRGVQLILRKQYGITRYPTFLLFKDSRYYIYEGNHSFESFSAYISKAEKLKDGQEIPDMASWSDKIVWLAHKCIEGYIDGLNRIGLTMISDGTKVTILAIFCILSLVFLPTGIRLLCERRNDKEKEE